MAGAGRGRQRGGCSQRRSTSSLEEEETEIEEQTVEESANDDDLIKKRSTPEFKAKSTRAALNKRGGKKDDIIEATHYAGSRSFLSRVFGKGKNKNKITMTAPELFRDTHTKLDAKGNRHWTKVKDKELYDAFTREKENTPQRPDNDIWFDLVEGYKKGSVYGTGEAHGAFYKAPSKRGSSKSKQTYEPGAVIVLQAQLDEERRKNEEERRKNAERDAERDAQIKEMKEKFDRFESFFSSCNPGPRPFFEDPNDPSGGGGFGAGASFPVIS